MPDLVQAVVQAVSADATVSTLTSGNVFGEELPPGNDMSMPSKVILIRAAGGSNQFGRGTLTLNDRRVNVMSYGETPHLATVVDEAAYLALKGLKPSVWASTYLHWCKQLSGPIPLRDPTLQWPYVISSYQVLISDVTVA